MNYEGSAVEIGLVGKINSISINDGLTDLQNSSNGTSPTNLNPGGDLGRNNIHQTTPLHTLKNIKGFRAVHLNIASLPKHLDELNLLFESKQVDVICINETRLDNTIDDPEMSILGYDLFR